MGTAAAAHRMAGAEIPAAAAELAVNARGREYLDVMRLRAVAGVSSGACPQENPGPLRTGKLVRRTVACDRAPEYDLSHRRTAVAASTSETGSQRVGRGAVPERGRQRRRRGRADPGSGISYRNHLL